MKREDLAGLGLTGEAADAVMALHGKDVERHKAAAQEWQQRYTGDTTALREQLAQQDTQHATAEAMREMRFSSKSARQAFCAALESKGLAYDAQAGRLEGFEDFARQYRAQDPEAFLPEGAEKLPVLVKPAQDSSAQAQTRGTNGALRRAFGL